jgi:hypothetical protein
LWPLCPEPSRGRRANNVIIPLDLTQLSCPRFLPVAGPPSSFTTYIVGCWGGALWRACNHNSFIHSLTGPVGQPFASRHEGPGFNTQGGTYVKPGFSCCLTTILIFYFAVYTCNVIFSVQTDQISLSALEGGGGLDPAFYNHGSGLEYTKLSVFGIQ